MYFTDYHLHTSFSADSEAPMEDMILAAIDKGLEEIAFTDHVDFDPRYTHPDYNLYIPYLEELKFKYKNDITIRLGIEVGLENTKADLVNTITAAFPFDFIIGSSHSVKCLDLYYDQNEYFSERTKQEAYNTYFEEMLLNIRTCTDFCVYGHLDFVSRYGLYEDNSVNYMEYAPFIDAVLKELIERGKGIEINTSGYRYGINGCYPSLEILKRYKALGGEIITVGSDAHFAKDAGDHVKEAYELLLAAGFKHITVFKGRQPKFITL